MKKIIFLMAMISLLANSHILLAADTDDYHRKALNMSKTINNRIINQLVFLSVLKQNKEHENMSDEEILELDKKWINGEAKELIDSKVNHKLGKYFRSIIKRHGKVYSEIFAMDNKGLIVATSHPTSDYWQGDEEKWLDTYATGDSYSFSISDPYLDDSTQKIQIQLSLPIVFNEEVIGAITFGISSKKIQ